MPSNPQFERKTHRARRVLDAAGNAYPGAWQVFDTFRRDRGRDGLDDWPDWCYMPIAAGYAIVSGGGNNRVPLARAQHPAIITALGTWRMTQGIYRYDADLYAALVDTPLTGDLPESVLYRLPEWCVYIETPDLTFSGKTMHGLWAHLECDVARHGVAELRLLLDCAQDVAHPMQPGELLPIPIILGGGTLLDALDRLDRSAAVQSLGHGGRVPPAAATSDTVAQLAPVLSLLLYLCSESPDLTRRGKPATPSNPEPKRTRRDGWRLFAASGPSAWDVGVRLGAALRRASESASVTHDDADTGRHVRGHVRRAHWHTMLSGPRKRADGTDIPSTQRRADLRWLPPIPVNLDDPDSMPSVIRPVR